MDTGAGPIDYYDIGVYEFNGDTDGDGIMDDGDESGTAGDNPCTGGATENCDDNCIDTPNTDQADVEVDGMGDICDNCLYTPNGPLQGTCVRESGSIIIGTGVTCTDNDTCGSDTCDMEQGDCNENGAGDACECYADFDNSSRVDLGDLNILKAEFFNEPCILTPPVCTSEDDGDCCCRADIVGSNRVDLAELNILKATFFDDGCPPRTEPCTFP